VADGTFPDLAVRETDEGDTPAVPLGSAGDDATGEGGLIVGKPNANSQGPGEAEDQAKRELIEPGRALAIADFAPPSANPAERLIRLAYRMGIPASMLALPIGRKVGPRLLATVTNPLQGERASGMALRAGHFLVHGVKTPIAQADFGGAARMVPPLERVVHCFEWLGDLDACGPREQVAPVAERILDAWLKANPKPPARPGKGAAWTVGNAGTRLLNCLVHAPLILSGVDRGLRSQTLHALSDTARWLDRNVTRAEDRLAETVGWCAIVAAGLLMSGGKPRRLFGEAGLMRAIGEMVGDDGGMLSRSPIAQMEAIAALIRLRACYEAVRSDPPEAVEGMLAMLVPPLLSLTHGDGSLGSWQGSWAVPASTVAALVDASRVRTRPLRDVRQWGYQRVAAGKSILQIDTAPPPMPGHARFGCASTLAFEMSTGGERLVVNCGGASCAGGMVPVRLEQALRATAAHSTLTLDDANSTAVLIGGAIGKGVSEVEMERRDLDLEGQGAATRIEAGHDGYAARYGLTHRRILILRSDGSELRGEDLLVPTGRKGKRGKVAFAIRFHLGPRIEARLSDDRQGAGLALPDGSYWQFRSGEGEIAIEESLWVDGGARPVPVQQLVIQGLVSRGGGSFSWLLKKMG
jgi:uncharacterized heparinase superfamily protein